MSFGSMLVLSRPQIPDLFFCKGLERKWKWRQC